MVLAESYIIIPWIVAAPFLLAMWVILWHELGGAAWLVKRRKKYGRRWLKVLIKIYSIFQDIWEGLLTFLFGRKQREKLYWDQIREEVMKRQDTDPNCPVCKEILSEMNGEGLHEN